MAKIDEAYVAAFLSALRIGNGFQRSSKCLDKIRNLGYMYSYRQK